MNKFIDINLQSNAEMPVNRLLNTLYTKLHKALCDLNSDQIGVSFPNYTLTLGDHLRIHGNGPDLEQLQNINWMGGVSGYCNLSGITPIPLNTSFRTISRKQTTMSHSKLKRLLKRGTISKEEVDRYKAKMFSQSLDNPYIELVSGSNGHRHRRFIEFGPIVDSATAGKFDQFGLSKIATIPWF